MNICPIISLKYVLYYGIIEEKPWEGLMYRTIRVQPATRSHLNISKPCSLDREVIREPTTPLIHSEARIWLIHSGRGVLKLQGETYTLEPGDVVCILPWQITDVIQVAEPLQYTLLIYDLDSVNRLMKAFYESDLLERGWLHSLSALPVLHCGGEAGKPVREIFAQLQEELGLESTLDAPSPAPYGNILVMSSLVRLCVQLERIRRQGQPVTTAGEPAGDKSQILRYMYVHLSEKLTLDMLSQLFYCSPSSISAYLTKATGLSFFDLLNEMRIGKTADYLLYTDLTLEELAEILGYVDASHISKVFSARVGMRIGAYRKTYQRVEEICQVEQGRLAYAIVQAIYRGYAAPMTAQETADIFGVSVSQLNRLLLCQVEKNFEDFLNYVRINRACEQLLHTRKPIHEISFEVGYNSTKTFTRYFLRQMAMTPSAFRSGVKGGQDGHKGGGK